MERLLFTMDELGDVIGVLCRCLAAVFVLLVAGSVLVVADTWQIKWI